MENPSIILDFLWVFASHKKIVSAFIINFLDRYTTPTYCVGYLVSNGKKKKKSYLLGTIEKSTEKDAMGEIL